MSNKKETDIFDSEPTPADLRALKIASLTNDVYGMIRDDADTKKELAWIAGIMQMLATVAQQKADSMVGE